MLAEVFIGWYVYIYLVLIVDELSGAVPRVAIVN